MGLHGSVPPSTALRGPHVTAYGTRGGWTVGRQCYPGLEPSRPVLALSGSASPAPVLLASGACPRHLGFSRRSRPRGTGPSPSRVSLVVPHCSQHGDRQPCAQRSLHLQRKSVCSAQWIILGISRCSCPHPVPLGTDPPTYGYLAQLSSLNGSRLPQSDYPFPLATDIGAGRVT